MDMEKSVKFFLLAGFAFLPMLAAYFMFDYKSLFDYNIAKEFSRVTVLISVAVIYTGVSILFRFLGREMLHLVKSKELSEGINEMGFMQWFYTSCIDTVIYGAIPIVINYLWGKDVLDFFTYTLLVYAASFLWFLICILIARGLNKAAK